MVHYDLEAKTCETARNFSSSRTKLITVLFCNVLFKPYACVASARNIPRFERTQ